MFTLRMWCSLSGFPCSSTPPTSRLTSRRQDLRSPSWSCRWVAQLNIASFNIYLSSKHRLLWYLFEFLTSPRPQYSSTSSLLSSVEVFWWPSMMKFWRKKLFANVPLPQSNLTAGAPMRKMSRGKKHFCSGSSWNIEIDYLGHSWIAGVEK